LAEFPTDFWIFTFLHSLGQFLTVSKTKLLNIGRLLSGSYRTATLKNTIKELKIQHADMGIENLKRAHPSHFLWFGNDLFENEVSPFFHGIVEFYDQLPTGSFPGWVCFPNV